MASLTVQLTGLLFVCHRTWLPLAPVNCILLHNCFFQEYLARLGIDTRAPHISHGASYQTLEGDMLRGDLSSMVYNRLQDDTMSEKNSLVSGGNNSVYARTGHPVSMTGSLSR